MSNKFKIGFKILCWIALVMFGPIAQLMPFLENFKILFLLAFYILIVLSRKNKVWYFAFECMIFLLFISVFIVKEYNIQFLLGTLSLGLLFVYVITLMITYFISMKNHKSNI